MKCLYCNNEIVLKRPRDRVQRFCNRSCSAKYLFRTPDKICAFCKKPYHSRGTMFCSIECYGKSQRSTYTKICPNCGKPFSLNNKAYEKRGRGKYCSAQCAHETQRKYSCDESFFNNINTQKEAYWLGFIFADGYQNGYEIVIRLSRIDREHLEKFKRDIKSNAPIRTKFEEQKEFKEGGKYISNFRMNSRKLCRSLTKLGCVKAKSLIIKFPVGLDKRLIRHFIRGYFDGDGCISKEKKTTTITVTFYSGSVEFIDGVEKIIKSANISCRRGIKDRRFLWVSKKAELPKIFNYLYRGSVVKLDRKYDKFKKFLLNRTRYNKPAPLSLC